MKIKKGDTVLIIAGKYRGKIGKILRALPQEKKILVEGVNLAKKHQRPRKEREKGQVIELPKPIDASNAKLICTKCGKPTKVGSRVEGKTKKRICKKCQQEI